ncbi:adenosylmethionine decarboxylase [Geobacillus genomosp. 3]|uniref:adenosylmethionine decarboxylase n=1 Tax=Geobacillus genomosp. 3 TaxID=1921421 RepID=UPI001F42D8ED|nr:adenosylmethionine decarboxylase [Geobacillus genomosp. 3]
MGGKHLILDAFECDSTLLNNQDYLEQLLTMAAQNAGMEVVYSYFHPFHPQGVTGMIVLATSHLSIHTWPEERYASLDFYTCGEHDPLSQVDVLLKGLQAKRAVVYSVSRGTTSPQLVMSQGMESFGSPKPDERHGGDEAVRGDKWDQIGRQALLRGKHKLLWDEKSAFQHLQMIEAKDVRMYLDGQLQFSSLDEHIYHEALVHPAFTFVPTPSRVLILGGGDGLALREVLKYPSVKHVDLVDLDPAVLQAAKKSKKLAALNDSSLSDSRVAVHPQDAVDFLAANRTLYPLIIVDFPDPTDETTSSLYTTEFYTLLKRCLADDGVFVCQSASLDDTPIVFWSIGKTIESAGFHTLSYHTIVPSFGDWGFHIGAKTALSWEGRQAQIPCRTLPNPLRDLSRFPSTILAKKPLAIVNSKQHTVLHHLFKQENVYW